MVGIDTKLGVFAFVPNREAMTGYSHGALAHGKRNQPIREDPKGTTGNFAVKRNEVCANRMSCNRILLTAQAEGGERESSDKSEHSKVQTGQTKVVDDFEVFGVR